MDRRREVVLAGHSGDDATARSALADPDPQVRCAALGALVRLGQLTPAEFGAALADDDPVVRRRAAALAPRAFDPAQMPVTELLEALEDPEWGVVETAASSLGEIDERSPHCAEAVTALTGVATLHQDPMCRESAVAALGSIGSESGLDAVLQGCGDRANVRRRAVLALAAFDDPRASEMLRSLTEDRDLQVSQAAEDLLAIETGEQI